MKAEGYDPRRVKMAALCSVCAEPFVAHMREFSDMLAGLNTAGAEAA